MATAPSPRWPCQQDPHLGHRDLRHAISPTGTSSFTTSSNRDRRGRAPSANSRHNPRSDPTWSRVPRRIASCLLANREWTINYNRFHRIIITSTTYCPARRIKYFVGYAPVATKSLVEDLVAHPRYVGQFANSSDIVELTFSPHGADAPAIVRCAPLCRGCSTARPFSTISSAPSLSRPRCPRRHCSPRARSTTRRLCTTVKPTVVQCHGLVDPSQDCRVVRPDDLDHAGLRHDSRGLATSLSGRSASHAVAVGPSTTRPATAALVAQQWRAQGIARATRRRAFGRAGRDHGRRRVPSTSRSSTDRRRRRRGSVHVPGTTPPTSTPILRAFSSPQTHQLFIVGPGHFQPRHCRVRRGSRSTTEF